MKELAIVVRALVVFVLTGCGANAEEKPDVGNPAAECTQSDTADFTESDAEACATSLGWAFRVGERDGESFALTADYF